MGGKTAADNQLGKNGYQIIFVPFFISITKDKIEGTGKLGHHFMSIAKNGFDPGAEPRGFKVAEGLTITPFVNLDGNELAARLTQGPGNPDSGMTGGGPNFESLSIFIFNDQVIEDPAIGFADIHVAPGITLALQESFNPRI